jgi:hypothetical protein
MQSRRDAAVAILFCVFMSSNSANGDTLYKRARRVAIGDATVNRGTISWQPCFSHDIQALKLYKQPPYWVSKEDNCRVQPSRPIGETEHHLLDEVGFAPLINFFKDAFRIGSDRPLILTVDPSVIEKGQAVTLTWRSKYDLGLEIQPDVGQLTGRRGTELLMPDRSTTYVLTAEGPGGKDQAKVHVIVTTAKK